MRGAISLDLLLCTTTNTAYHQSWLSKFNLEDLKSTSCGFPAKQKHWNIHYVSEASTTELELH